MPLRTARTTLTLTKLQTPRDTGGGSDKKAVTFSEFQAKIVPQLRAVDYKETHAASKGVLGNTTLLEYRRVNQAGEEYHVGYCVMTIGDDGLIHDMKVYG